MPPHLTMAELEAGMPTILQAPKDAGRLEAIVARPAKGERRSLERAMLSLAGGVEGDHWALGCWKSTADGQPDPDVQICIMNARAIGLIAGDRANWPPAGDNLYLDMDLSPDNLPPGTRLALGDAVLEITAVPHTGCAQFIERFGRDACASSTPAPARRTGCAGSTRAWSGTAASRSATSRRSSSTPRGFKTPARGARLPGGGFWPSREGHIS